MNANEAELSIDDDDTASSSFSASSDVGEGATAEGGRGPLSGSDDEREEGDTEEEEEEEEEEDEDGDDGEVEAAAVTTTTDDQSSRRRRCPAEGALLLSIRVSFRFFVFERQRGLIASAERVACKGRAGEQRVWERGRGAFVVFHVFGRGHDGEKDQAEFFEGACVSFFFSPHACQPVQLCFSRRLSSIRLDEEAQPGHTRPSRARGIEKQPGKTLGKKDAPAKRRRRHREEGGCRGGLSSSRRRR